MVLYKMVGSFVLNAMRTNTTDADNDTLNET